MTPARYPPRIPGLLLEWFIPDNVALAGDLVEEYRRRGSTSWYWRQVMAAIVVDLASDIRAHKLLVVRAIASGWATMWVFSFVGAEINRFMSGWVLDQLILMFWTNPFPMMWATQLWFRPAMALGFVTSGWVVGRLHRNNLPAMVVAFMLTVLAWTLYQDAWALMNPRMTIDSSRSIPRPYPLFDVLFAPLPLLILVGGLWGSRKDRRAPCRT